MDEAGSDGSHRTEFCCLKQGVNSDSLLYILEVALEHLE